MNEAEALRARDKRRRHNEAVETLNMKIAQDEKAVAGLVHVIGSDEPGHPSSTECFNIDAMNLAWQEDGTRSASDLKGILLHSVVFMALREKGLIDFVSVSENQPKVPMLAGKPVIVDDHAQAVPGENRIFFDTLLLGQSALDLFDQDLSAHPANLDKIEVVAVRSNW